MKKKVLMLGSNGYIGSKIPRSNDEVEIYPYRKFSEVLNEIEFDIILNLAASKGNSSEEESFKANYVFPRNIIEKLSNFNGKWIQISSYYELQIPFGRNDSYSKHKASFREFINEEKLRRNTFEVLSLVLPHVFGSDEANHRLIPSIKNLRKGRASTFGHQGQFIPLLEVNDAVKGIQKALSLDSELGLKSLSPFWSGTLLELLNELNIEEDEFRISTFREQENSFDHNRLEFPDPLQDFRAKFDIEQLKTILG